jgi:hypothetical protein
MSLSLSQSFYLPIFFRPKSRAVYAVYEVVSKIFRTDAAIYTEVAVARSTGSNRPNCEFRVNMIYLTAIGLTPGGSGTVQIYTQYTEYRDGTHIIFKKLNIHDNQKNYCDVLRRLRENM